MSSSKKNIYIFLGLLAVLSLAYLPVLQAYYVHHDDYYFWAWGRSAGCSAHPVFGFLAKECGRPLAGYVVCMLGVFVRSLFAANIARFFIVVILSSLAFITYLWCSDNSIEMTHSLLLSVMFFTLPAYQSNVATICNGNTLIAALISAVAALLAEKGASRLSGWKSYFSINFFWAIILLVMSLMMHQAAAMFYWFLVAIMLINIDYTRWKEVRKKALVLFAVNFAAMGTYFLYTKTLKTQGSQYAAVVTKDFVGKFKWLIDEPLIDTLNLWTVYPSSTITKMVVCVLFLGVLANIFLMFKRKNVPIIYYIQKCFLVICTIPLTYFANLAAANNLSAYRSLLAVSPLAVYFLYCALKELSQLLAEDIRRELLTGALVVLCLIGIYMAHYNLMNYYAFPQTIELRYIKSAILQTDLSKIKRIHVIKHDPIIGYSYFAPSSRYDEFAVSATSFWQDVAWVTKCAMKEAGRGEYFDKLQISSSTKAEYKGFPEETLLIDMTRFNYFY